MYNEILGFMEIQPDKAIFSFLIYVFNILSVRCIVNNLSITISLLILSLPRVGSTLGALDKHYLPPLSVLSHVGRVCSWFLPY